MTRLSSRSLATPTARAAAEYNQELSERRAQTVATYLAGKGLMHQRIITVGAGETQPVATNDTTEGRQLNRRVELTLAPITA